VNTPCAITYTEVSKACNQNGTPNNGADDTWTVVFRIANQNTALLDYSYTYNGQLSNGTYGESKSITLPMTASSLTITFSDATQSGCSKVVSINRPTPCVIVLPPNPTPVTYCPVSSAHPWEEWIAGVRLGNTWIKYSGKDGYADFTATTGTIRAGSNDIRILNQFSYITSLIYTKVWIDANKDGQFGTNELVVSRSTSAPSSRNMATSTMIASFNIPTNWFSGTTRMRIICSKEPIVNACTNLNRGEIEDYTVSLTSSTLVSSPAQIVQNNEELEPLLLFPNPATRVVHIVTTPLQSQKFTIQLIGSDNIIHHQAEIEDMRGDTYTIPVEGLSSGLYFVRIILPGKRPQVQKLVVQSND
jgi:hypothetical protein